MKKERSVMDLITEANDILFSMGPDEDIEEFEDPEAEQEKELEILLREERHSKCR